MCSRAHNALAQPRIYSPCDHHKHFCPRTVQPKLPYISRYPLNITSSLHWRAAIVAVASACRFHQSAVSSYSQPGRPSLLSRYRNLFPIVINRLARVGAEKQIALVFFDITYVEHQKGRSRLTWGSLLTFTPDIYISILSNGTSAATSITSDPYLLSSSVIMVVVFVKRRLLVGWRHRDWSPVWYEPASNPDEDGGAILGLYSLAEGEAERREPMEGEVIYIPHFDPARCESKVK
nr:hypothetical protein CFP56_46692 [Quercus suber]